MKNIYVSHVAFLFAALVCISLPAYTQSVKEQVVAQAQSVFDQLDKANAYLEKLNISKERKLPFGFRQSINNMEVAVAVCSTTFYTDKILFNAYLRVTLPGEKGQKLFFGANDLQYSQDGGILGNARLTLLSNVEIPINDNILLRILGDYDPKTGTSSGLTSATIDCNGITGMELSAEVELSDQLCTKVDKEGNAIGGKVTGQFQTSLESWNDFVVSVSFPSFAINGLNGFVWDLQDAVLDFSDLQNAPVFHFPDDYRSYMVPGNQELWRGVYVRNLSVTLPPAFAQADKKRVSFGTHDMLIDDNGITGEFFATHVLSFEQGNASGWSFSVDKFGVQLMANRLEGVNFAGEIGLPVSEKTRLGYNGTIAANDTYMLEVLTADTLAFDFLQAKAQLLPNSYLKMGVENGQFRPEAMLHGSMGITAMLPAQNGGDPVAQFKGVTFQSLHLQTHSPYLSVQYMGYAGEVKLLNFPVSVSDIAFETKGNDASLAFDLKLALMDGDLAGNTRLSIGGTMEGGEKQRWRYQRTDIEKLRIKATVANVFDLDGELAVIQGDPTYGNCFGGALEMAFAEGGPLRGLGLKARGMFGYKDFRYWFVDGLASLQGNGIPIGTALFLKGFGGGVSYRMMPKTGAGVEAAPLSVMATTYLPNEKANFGIKAVTDFVIGKDGLINGEASFELAFNNHGGLSYAGFYGFVQMAGGKTKPGEFIDNAMASFNNLNSKQNSFTGGGTNEASVNELDKMKQYEPNKYAEMVSDRADERGRNGLTAVVGIQFNFEEKSFHSTFDFYANVLGGVIRGVGAGNRAGYAVMHVDPQDWYFYMGTPTDRIGLKMGIGNILNIKTDSYLMAGTQIPGSPGVPPQVARILGYEPDDLDYMKDLNVLGNGKGFAFGSSLSIDTGDLTFLILYANYSAGVGFDIMLKDYSDAQCKGRSGAIGMDGWYANGQAYAYMHGELGAKINLWFMKAKVPIFRADIAALMQAKLPNPSSFKAYLAVKAKVLGLVSISCRFKVLIGEDCELIIPGGSPLDMQMISDLSPTDASEDVNVFTAPQATFNTVLGKAFDVQDDEGEKTFRVQLKEFVLDNGQNIIGGLKWGEDKDAVSFYSHEILPPNADITATVRVNFEEWKNGRWNLVYTAGKEAVESKTIRFRTGDAPKEIPMANVLYAYPVVGQQYYLRDEGGNKGYIQLQHGQTYLFPKELKNQVVYEDTRGSKQYADFVYNESLKRIDYTVPQIDFVTPYKVSIVSLSKDGGTGSEVNNAVSTVVAQDEEDGNITVDSKQASAETRTDVGKVLLGYEFASSRYASFAQKMAALQKTQPTVVGLSSDLLMFGHETTDMEPFDVADLTGTGQTENKPLVDVSATLEDDFYQKDIYPLVYKDYPIDGTFKVHRKDIEWIGIPPVKALPIRTDYLNSVEQGVYTGIVNRYFPYYYNLPAVYKEDFLDIQNQVVNALLGKGGTAYDRFLLGTFPFIRPGAYKIKLQYTLPGNVKGSAAEFEYTNFVK